ncbi:uncharacterized protein PHALS_00985 [Plasmopara halstedii]|uniref:Uncharacterized protein n=1 Tax=Plasmopara halstedii TaxID=4781 RepID=A0A0P1ASD2_PLAHL|nr:uncharacterized protein PHALS_00985 [Plasmopara halstedii]CEG44639.1 hypothetical protein PHALS_00985 [Plasmopara halstedii]|eukprot:XP_024581008.1 hypothetical protein PHALS_00985 [Plasmopara halstedii]
MVSAFTVRSTNTFLSHILTLTSSKECRVVQMIRFHALAKALSKQPIKVVRQCNDSAIQLSNCYFLALNYQQNWSNQAMALGLEKIHSLHWSLNCEIDRPLELER